MMTLLRLLALLLGTALTLAPTVLLLLSHGTGQLPAGRKLFDLLAPLLVIGLAFGLGPLLLALPRLVAGDRTPAARLVAALLLLVSAGGLVLSGMGGLAGLLPAVLGLLAEGVLCAVFVWPARRFSAPLAAADQDQSPSR
ncbi:hypothetical protein LZ012_00520 [Dechloromonas sp. XY25]|uniref:DUF4345 domain-containing protein n=1 Tax=Dechloromonas hankyongensis TaxID=2908002 RepID=A0ABS9JX33_9RHOO|nr:hypothetical protein [Dechloromonas hankyongensis]MCG2575471.1 hypothetical protein [Dechloromonas hankyongensis]